MGKTREKKEEELHERCNSMPEIPDKFRQWCKGRFKEVSWLFYRRKGKYIDMFCTECGMDFTVKNVRNETYEGQFERIVETPKRNQIGKCPKCGKQVIYKTGMRKDEYGWYIHAAIGQEYKKENYVLRWFTVYKTFGPDKQNEYEYYERARVFFTKGRVAIQKDYYFYNGWRNGWCWHFHNTGGLGNIAIPKELHIYPETYRNMKGTCVEYSMARDYIKQRQVREPMKRWNEYEWDIVSYLSAYKRNPVLELLVKCNCTNLTDYVVRGVLPTNWRAKTPWDMLGINKKRLKDAIDLDDFKMIEWFKLERAEGKELKDEELEWIKEQNIDFKAMRKILERTTMRKAINYITKQTKNGNCEQIHKALDRYNDYISMAERLKYDTYDEIVYKPKSIDKAHAKLIKESERTKVEEAAKEVYEKYPKIKDKFAKAKRRYEFRNDKFVLKMPKSVEDVMMEGRTLHHCVSASDRYFERIVTGETFIGFVRRTEEEDVPFYSIEFEPGGNVRQKRTYYNRHDEHYNDVIAFLLEWQQEVKKHMTKKEKQMAEISRKKRLEGMKEYRLTSPDFAEKMEADYMAADNEPPQVMLDIEEIAGREIA